MKKLNWKTIMPQKISENSFWATCNESEFTSENILADLAAKFSSKSSPILMDKPLNKKYVALHVLERQQAQNILISLGTLLKRQSHEQIKQSILRCDTSVLNSNAIQQLIKYLPSPNDLMKLQKIKEAGNELSAVERLVVTLGEIHNLMPRLHCIDFKVSAAEIIADIQPDIASGIAACKEMKKSEKFSKILGIVLLFGNYMNSSSSTSGQAFGFELSSLKKLQDTKDMNNKQTLLQHVVYTIGKNFPELLNFGEELPHVNMAARINLENIHDTVRRLIISLDILKSALKNNTLPQSSDDKFIEVMGDLSAKYGDQIEKLNEMKDVLENSFKELGEYFTFCIHEYPIEEFFSDIKNFKDSFEQVSKENKLDSTILKQPQNYEAHDTVGNRLGERKQRGLTAMIGVLSKLNSESEVKEMKQHSQPSNQPKLEVNKSGNPCRECFVKLDRIPISGLYFILLLSTAQNRII